MSLRGTASTSATGLIICRKPPETRYTRFCLLCSALTSSRIPGVSTCNGAAVAAQRRASCNGGVQAGRAEAGGAASLQNEAVTARDMGL